jgi:hypothetical protein
MEMPREDGGGIRGGAQNLDRETPMVLLPRIARILHHPGLAGLLGVVLLGICAIGLLGGEIPTGWSILIGVVGAINLARLVRHPSGRPPDA